jgi:hypothetical protein
VDAGERKSSLLSEKSQLCLLATANACPSPCCDLCRSPLQLLCSFIRSPYTERSTAFPLNLWILIRPHLEGATVSAAWALRSLALLIEQEQAPPSGLDPDWGVSLVCASVGDSVVTMEVALEDLSHQTHCSHTHPQRR